MIRKNAPVSRLGALLQNESCVVLQVSYGVNGKDICMNVSKRGLSEIKEAKKRCSVWGGSFHVVLQKCTC